MENPCSNTIPCSNTFAALNYLTEENLPAVLTEEQRLNLPAVRDSVPKSVSWAGARSSTVVLPVTLATIFEEDESQCDAEVAVPSSAIPGNTPSLASQGDALTSFPTPISTVTDAHIHEVFTDTSSLTDIQLPVSESTPTNIPVTLPTTEATGVAIDENVLVDAAGLCTSPNVYMQRPTEVLNSPETDHSPLASADPNFETLVETIPKETVRSTSQFANANQFDVLCSLDSGSFPSLPESDCYEFESVPLAGPQHNKIIKQHKTMYDGVEVVDDTSMPKWSVPHARRKFAGTVNGTIPLEVLDDTGCDGLVVSRAFCL